MVLFSDAKSNKFIVGFKVQTHRPLSSGSPYDCTVPPDSISNMLVIISCISLVWLLLCRSNIISTRSICCCLLSFLKVEVSPQVEGIGQACFLT